jgi:hypothetical protein
MDAQGSDQHALKVQHQESRRLFMHFDRQYVIRMILQNIRTGQKKVPVALTTATASESIPGRARLFPDLPGKRTPYFVNKHQSL